MKGLRLVVSLFAVYIGFTGLKAQPNLEFVENKGQWDKAIAFEGVLKTGAFAIQADGGYRMMIHNSKELAALSPHHRFSGSAALTKNKQTFSITPKRDVVNNPSDEGSPSGAISVLHSHIYEVKFLNANPHPQLIPDKPLSAYNNYIIGNDKSKWAGNCKIYQAVTCKDVYPDIDVRYYTNNGQLKYDIIVNPGGNINAVALYYDGVAGLQLKNGSLIINTSADDVKELRPVSYSVSQSGKKEVPCNYEVKGNIVRFKVEKPDQASTLVIDPQFIFATFSGSTADNWGYTATYDAAGNFYAGGIVFGVGFRVNNGAFQTSFQGGGNEGSLLPYDAGIMKFDPTGKNRIYATYLGGSGNEQPHSMVVDNNGNLIIAGRTSSGNFPTTSGPFGSGGGFDIFLTKLNVNGTALVGSRRIGGSSDDGINIRAKYVGAAGYESTRLNYGDDARSEVITDGAGNIYLASCTQSTNFPVTANAFQQKNGAANANGFFQDAVLLKASPDLSTILFSSLLGGNDNDAAFVLALNPSDNNIYVAGGTASSNFPGVPSSGVKFTTFQGGICDGFVAIISNDGSQLIRSSYFGTTGADMLFGIQFDRRANPYILGTTNGTWPVVNSPFNQLRGQKDGKQFICKLKADLSDFIYSATFGAPGSLQPNISPTAFLVDRCDNVYVSGWGGGLDIDDHYLNSGVRNMSTPNYLQNTTDGSDFYFFVLASDATDQLFGSYFGQNGGLGDHVDGGTSRFDKNGIIYQTICSCNQPPVQTPLSGFPPDVFSPINPSPDCNIMALKIAFNLAGLASGIQAAARGIPRDTSGCVPLNVNFTDTIGLAKKYLWDFNDGSPEVATTNPAITHTFNNIGVYKVRLVAIDSSTCNISDTSYVNLRVRNDEALLALNITKLGGCTSLAYQFDNNSVSPPGKPFNSQSFILDFGDGTSIITGTQSVTHTFPAQGTYKIHLVLQDTGYCNQADSIVKQLRIASNVKAAFQTPLLGCVPYTAVMDNTSHGGTDFLWYFGDGSSSTEINPTHLYNDTGTYIITLVATDTSTCNKTDTASLAISVKIKSAADFSVSPQPPLSNTPIDFTNLSQPATSYKWLFGDGDSLITTSIATPVSHIYDSSKTYTACLAVTNQSGCVDVKCQPVQALIRPIFDVPNAFTPNGDGINDRIFVKGYGITKMKWNIYNRWGTMVFQSSGKNNGWDGRYNGQIQPQDVYHYILTVEMSDGTKYTKKGDITLLR